MFTKTTAIIILAIFCLTQAGLAAPAQNLRAEAAAQGKFKTEVGEAVMASAAAPTGEIDVEEYSFGRRGPEVIYFKYSSAQFKISELPAYFIVFIRDEYFFVRIDNEGRIAALYSSEFEYDRPNHVISVQPSLLKKSADLVERYPRKNVLMDITNGKFSVNFNAESRKLEFFRFQNDGQDRAYDWSYNFLTVYPLSLVSTPQAVALGEGEAPALAGAAGNLPLNHRVVPVGQEKFLVANLGSTSVKMELQNAQGNLLAKGATKGNIGDAGCNFIIDKNGEKQTVENIASHEDALKAFVEAIKPITDNAKGIQAVFYKTVQGGPLRKGTFVLDEPTLRAMEETYRQLAKPHNEFYAFGARILEGLLPDAIHLGRFERATHKDNTMVSRTTSLPYRIAQVFGLDADGFHGASFAYLIKRVPQMLKKLGIKVDGDKTIMFHIGGSSSACMSEDGKSIETSMMGTPNSGFTQGTRITGNNVNSDMARFLEQGVAGLIEKYYARELKSLFEKVNFNKWGSYKKRQDVLNRLVDGVVANFVNNGTLKGERVSYEKESIKGIKRLSRIRDLIVADAVRHRIDRMFIEESGLKGIAGIGTGDVEKIKQAADSGNKQAQLAYNILIAEARGYLGSYILKLGGKVDVIVFTAGTGENDAEFRSRVIGDGIFFGRQVIKLDAERNNAMIGGKEGIVSVDDSDVKVLVIKANEAATLVEDGLAKYREIVSAAGQPAAAAGEVREAGAAGNVMLIRPNTSGSDAALERLFSDKTPLTFIWLDSEGNVRRADSHIITGYSPNLIDIRLPHADSQSGKVLNRRNVLIIGNNMEAVEKNYNQIVMHYANVNVDTTVSEINAMASELVGRLPLEVRGKVGMIPEGIFAAVNNIQAILITNRLAFDEGFLAFLPTLDGGMLKDISRIAVIVPQTDEDAKFQTELVKRFNTVMPSDKKIEIFSSQELALEAMKDMKVDIFGAEGEHFENPLVRALLAQLLQSLSATDTVKFDAIQQKFRKLQVAVAAEA